MELGFPSADETKIAPRLFTEDSLPSTQIYDGAFILAEGSFQALPRHAGTPGT